MNWSVCLRCNDVGVLRVKLEDLGTLVKCGCEVGRDQNWELPFITELPTGTRESSVPRDFFVPQSDSNERPVKERISYWTEKIRVAEEYWRNNPLAPRSDVLIRKPYKDED